ncbi:MAG: hypothetical protein A2905_04125 [Candidatus Levybacteria bacterium RIFCSPLOWO2_01_FULL_36_10]|nr:MAG: hypothetical protein A2905_04125 [Candidatus Levybacteria bacterium RIFCSPLOWO2_01_FULL_36_10]
MKKFPESFPSSIVGEIHEKKGITLNDQDFSMLKHGNEMFFALYELDGRYNFLKPRDFVKIENQDQNDSSKYYLQITHVESAKVKDYLKQNPQSEWIIERQIGMKPDAEKTLNAYEFKKTYDFVVERKKSEKGKS